MSEALYRCPTGTCLLHPNSSDFDQVCSFKKENTSMKETKECKPTGHNFLQVGTKDQTVIVVCTKCGKVVKV